MSAAPCDFRPSEKIDSKIKKNPPVSNLSLTLNPDILKTLYSQKKSGDIWVGFAAESEDLLQRAIAKLHDKNLDYIVGNYANQENSAFGKDFTKIIMLDSTERIILETGEVTKFNAAWGIIDTLAKNAAN
jgi:phosphopantothenoylcysteine decarboxylase/phosphopantothenate--cysteine ligase